MTLKSDTLGTAAKRIKQHASMIGNDAHLAAVSIKATANVPGQADGDLMQTAKILEIAASDLRILHARGQSSLGSARPATRCG